MNNLVREFRYSLRVLIKNPGTSIVAVLALALGIGVNASSFAVTSSVSSTGAE